MLFANLVSSLQVPNREGEGSLADSEVANIFLKGSGRSGRHAPIDFSLGHFDNVGTRACRPTYTKLLLYASYTVCTPYR